MRQEGPEMPPSAAKVALILLNLCGTNEQAAEKVEV
jgi:hypothetical protein